MKILLTLTLSFFTSAVMACTDFSGSYKDEVASVYSVVQSGCSTVMVNNNEGTETIIADGQFRVTEENAEVRISSAANFIGDNLTIEGRIEYLIALPPEVPVELIPVKFVTVYTLDSAGNLWMNFTIINSKDQVIGESATMHQRV